MKRVGVYLEAMPEGGGYFQYAEILLEALAELPATTFDVHCWYRGDAWAERLKSLGLKHEPVEKKPRGFTKLHLSVIKRLARLLPNAFQGKESLFSPPIPQILRWKPHTLLLPQPGSFPLPADIRQITPIHDLMHIYERRFPEVGTAKEIASRERLFGDIVRRCAVILVDSPLGGEHLRANYPIEGEQIKVLPYVASSALLACPPRRPEALVSERFLFYPAQFWEHKNHARMIEALALALQKCPDIHCVLCGATKYSGFRTFTDAVARHGVGHALTVLGYVENAEIAWCYRNARSLFMPTFFGPTNIPPLEAMALGCPVAVSDIYAMPWQCGDAAEYFNPESAEDMAQIMCRLWTDDALCDGLRERGRRRSEAWDKGHMKEQFLGILLDRLPTEGFGCERLSA